MLGALKSCDVLFFLNYIQHWKAKGLSVHLHAGASFARGLEVARKAFYEGEYAVPVTGTNLTGEKLTWFITESREPGDAESSIACGLRALLVHYGNYECPPDSAKSLERTAGALEFYFDKYPLQFGEGSEPIVLPSGKRAIEFSFAHPLPINHPETGDPLLYVGRMDSILQYAGGSWICDEKTTTQLGPTWGNQWDLRAQFTGYAWGCREAGIRVEGAMVRGISILKTKYDTQQIITYRPDWQIDRWYEQLLSWIEDLIQKWKHKRYRHNLDHTCQEYGGCQFKRICVTSTPEAWMDTYFERRVWNPLLRTETLLESVLPSPALQSSDTNGSGS